MDSANISPGDLALMERLLNCIWPASEAMGSQVTAPLSNPHPRSAPITESYLPSHAPPPLPLLHSAPIAESNFSSHAPPPLLCSAPIAESHFPSHAPQLPSLSSTPITELYSSTRIPQVSTVPLDDAYSQLGHPGWAPVTARASSATQPFLGFNNLSINMRGQANQCHLASAAATLLRQPHLVTRGWGNCHWGPAILPPSLPRRPSITDCIYFTPDLNGTNVQMIWVKAIVYPPMPPTNIRVSKIRQYIVYLLLILGLESPQVYVFSTVTCEKKSKCFLTSLN